MIGVILWSDAVDQKAVIWCDDQGDLAFLSRHENVVLPEKYFSVGDVVEFNVRTVRNMRLASNPVLVQQDAGVCIYDDLHVVSAHACDMATDTATVIPFCINHAARPDVTTLRHEKRHG